MQAEAGRESIAAQERALERARGDLQPFRETGGEILNPLLDFVKSGPESELERTQGFSDIQESAAAAGKLRSGGTLRSLTEFNNMLNARNRNQRFNELFNLAALGSNAASGQATATQNTGRAVGSTLEGIGNVRAAGEIGGANAARNTLFSLGKLAMGL